MSTIPLTDTGLKALRRTDKAYKVALGGDGVGGLHVMVYPNGTKVFKLSYHFGGKAKLYTIGKYGILSLAEAREQARDAKRQMTKGVDPSAVKQQEKLKAKSEGITFKSVTEDWLALRQVEWSSVHLVDTKQKLGLHIYPYIGGKPIKDVSKADIRAILDRLQAQNKSATLKKVRNIISLVLRYAIAIEIPGVEVDWAVQLSGKQYSNPEPKHRAALTSPAAVGGLMRAITAYRDISVLTALALRFSALTFCRPGEVRQAEWQEVDTASALWRIPGSKMKAGQPHLVPLAKQTLELLHELKTISGHKRYLFPSAWGKDRPMSEATVLAALRRMGFTKEQMSAHGFRGMASTLLNENGFNRDWVERQLAHGERNQVRAAYLHSDFLADRRTMMQWWADYLDKLESDTHSLSIKKGE